MVRRYEPQTRQRAANQLVQWLNAELSGDPEDKALMWKRTIKTYEQQTVKVFPEEFSNTPESAIKTHILMRTELADWTDFRQETMSCTRALKASARLSPTPMDIGAFSLGKRKKGKNGKDEKCGTFGHTTDQRLSDHVRSMCGKKGHGADKCLSKVPSSSTAPPGKGERDKRKCFICGKTEHVAARCQSKTNPWRPSRTERFQRKVKSGR